MANTQHRTFPFLRTHTIFGWMIYIEIQTSLCFIIIFSFFFVPRIDIIYRQGSKNSKNLSIHQFHFCFFLFFSYTPCIHIENATRRNFYFDSKLSAEYVCCGKFLHLLAPFFTYVPWEWKSFPYQCYYQTVFYSTLLGGATCDGDGNLTETCGFIGIKKIEKELEVS